MNYTNILKNALKYYFEKGFIAFPLHLDIKDVDGKQTKVPIFPLKWQSEAITKEKALRLARTNLYTKTFGFYNAIAIITGKKSNLFVLDIDKKNGRDGHDYLKQQNIIIPKDTPCIRTQSDGRHYYFRFPEELEGYSTSSDPNNCIDFRGEGGFVFAPPNNLHDTMNYKWLEKINGKNLRQPPKALIDWILGRRCLDRSGGTSTLDLDQRVLQDLTDEQKRIFNELFDNCASPKTEDRSKADLKLFLWSIKIRLSKEVLREIVYPVGKFAEKAKQGHFDDYFDRTFKKALTEVQKDPDWQSKPNPISNKEEEIHETDTGNAKRFVSLYGENIRFCHPLRTWYIWDGKLWRADNTATIEVCAKETALSIYKEVPNEKNENKRQQLSKWAMRSESKERIQAIIALAKSEPGIPILPNELDRNQWLFNVLNGQIDLKTGKRLPQNKNDFISKIAPVEFNPDIRPGRFIKFLNEIFDDNQDLIAYIKRLFGYCLTGSTQSDVIPIFWGSGANGKSTLIGTIQALMGEYAKQAPSDLLLRRKNDTHPTGLADLFGTRFVVSVETDENKKFAEALAKQMTGGDKIKARFMHRDYFEYDPTHKIILVTNHKPNIEGTDYAIWRRIHLVPFRVQIPPEKRDESLRVWKFKDEWPGILNLLIEGCLEWQKKGLDPPPEVIKATEEYKSESDIIGEWFKERIQVDKESNEFAPDLYNNYKEWCQANGEQPATSQMFGRKLTEKGFSHGKRRGKRCWFGIKLIKEV